MIDTEAWRGEETSESTQMMQAESDLNPAETDCKAQAFNGICERHMLKSPGDFLVQGGVAVHLAKARRDGMKTRLGIRRPGFYFILCPSATF